MALEGDAASSCPSGEGSVAGAPPKPDPTAEGKTTPEEQQTFDLPEDPFNPGSLGGLYLRLTNECPPGGIRIVLMAPPKIALNDRFKDKTTGKPKQEYHWPVTQYLEGWQPVEKILVESRPAFRRAVVSAVGTESPYNKPLLIRWVKERKNENQQRSVFIVSVISPEEIRAASGSEPTE